MTAVRHTTLIDRVRGGFRRLKRDASGMAAIEFGLIAPVLALMFVNAVDLTRALEAHRRFSDTTAMIADLVARESELKKADVTAIYQIAAVSMAPYSTTTLNVKIVPVASNPNNAGNTVVYPATTNRPSFPEGGEAARCQAFPLPSGIVGKNESVIVIQTSYSFTPMFLPSMSWSDVAYAKPRKAGCVDFDFNKKPCGTCFS